MNLCNLWKEEEEEQEDIKGKGGTPPWKVLQRTSGTLVFTVSEGGHHGKISVNRVTYFDLHCKRICLAGGYKTDYKQ